MYHAFFFACMTNQIQILLILFPFILGQILYLSFQVKHDVSYASRETYPKEASTYTQEEKKTTADFLLNIQSSNNKLSLSCEKICCQFYLSYFNTSVALATSQMLGFLHLLHRINTHKGHMMRNWCPLI